MILKDNYNLNKIQTELKENGFCVIDNIFEENINAQLKKIAMENITKYNNKKFSLHEKYFTKSFIDEIINSEEICSLFKSINIDNLSYKGGYNYHFLLNHTPKLKNNNSKLSFHFDAYLLTMIIPINTGQKQHNAKAMSLEVIPNIRKITNSMLWNLTYKIIFQNKIVRKVSNSS